MKKLFNLLCKNAIRIFWKSKWLFIQFILLLFLALTIFSSIFLSNSTLSDSINYVINEGNLAAASVEDLTKKDNIQYNFELNNIPDSLTKEDTNNNTLFDPYNPSQLNWSNTVNISGIKVYNPMVEQQLAMGSSNELLTLYGFNHFTNNINQSTSSVGKEIWPNLLYSKNDDFCIQINTLLTDSSYKDDLVNVFSFYKNVLQPNNLSDNFQELYSPEYYNYNPFKLYLINNEIKPSILSGGLIDTYYDQFDQIYADKSFPKELMLNLTFGTVSKKMGALVQYDNSILKDKPSNTELNDYWQKIIVNDNKAFSNNSLIKFPLDQSFNSIQQWEDWCANYLDSYSIVKDFYSDKLYSLYNEIPIELKSNFIEPVGWLRFDYKFNPIDSSGLSSFLYEQMANKNISLAEAKELGYIDEYKNLFKSTINIPLIPNITLIRNEPTNKETYKTEINNLSKYKDNWSIDTNYVSNLLLESTSNLSLALSTLNELVILPNWISSNNENLQKLYLEYLSKYDIAYNILSSNVKFTKTSTTNISSDSNQYILSEISNNNINKYIPTEGIDLNQESYEPYLDTKTIKFLQDLILKIKGGGIIDYEEYISVPYIFNAFKILSLADYNNTENTKHLYKVTSYLSNKDNLQNKFQWSKYLDILREFALNYELNAFITTDYGYKMRVTIKVAGISGMTIPMPGVYKTNNASIIGLSTNYSKIKNKTYKVVDQNFVKEALKLPEFISESFRDTIKNDPYLSKNHYIYNPYSNKKEFYLSYDDWLQKLPNKYKLNISGEYYVVSSIGTSPEFLYPIQNSNQLLLNNDVPVVYCNKNSYGALTTSQSTKPKSYLWLEFPDNWTVFDKNNFLNKINKFSLKNFNKNIAYYINDNTQPNKLLYLRINFPDKILKIVTLATSFIGVIIGILAIFFISVLLRSIIKQNMPTISVLLSNGVSKGLIALSTFIYVLLPSFISSLLGYIVSLFIFPIINGAVHDYWALDIANVALNFIPFFIMFLTSFVILFISLYLVIIWTLRKPVPTLLNTTVEFKMNKFIMWTKPMFRKANVMNSFRFSFMFGNFSRFLILTILMTSFASIFNVFTGSINMFQNSLQYTIDNNSSIDGKKKMAYSFDLTTPTPAGGYYYNINENELGSNSHGYIPFMDLNSEVSDNPYNSTYKDVLTYINPESGQSITYEQLGLIDITIINQITANLKFFNNKIWTRLILDFDINFLNQMINPWSLAKANLASDIVSIADNKFNTQISDAFKYFLYLYSDEYLNNSDLHYINPKPTKPQPSGYSYNPYEKIDPEFKYYWYVNSSDIKPDEKPNLIKDITKNGKISSNPADWNQSNWYYQCSLNLDGSYTWKLNSPYVTVGLPSFAINKDLAKLIINIISLPINPDYKLFKNFINEDLKNYNSFFSTNTIPISNGDSLYTYIDGTIKSLNKLNIQPLNINIKGINPKDTSIINLWYDNKNGNYMDLLDKYDQEYTTEIPQINNKDVLDKVAMPYSDGTYPLIINKVVAKKYGYKKGDIITVRLNNMFDRHRMMNDNEEFPFGNFKIVGITESTSEEQFYTTQTITNSLLGLKKPIYTNLDSPEVKDGNFKNYWVNEEDVKNYTPFNGIMTNNINHPMLNNSLTLYTESGLSPLDGWIDVENGVVEGAFRFSWRFIDDIFNYDIVENKDLQYRPTIRVSTEFVEKYQKLYGTDKFFLLNLKDVKSTLITRQLGIAIDNTIGNVFNILLISFVPTLIIILLLLSYIIILEARRLIALLKVLGFNNWINTITLIFSYFISVGISVLLSIGLSYGILFGLSELMFNFINVITYPSTPIWSHFVNIAVLLGLVFSLALMTYLKLKKTKPTEIIAIR